MKDRRLFPLPSSAQDAALLLLRLVVALIFVDGGWNHLAAPAARAADLGLSKAFVIFLGGAEIAGGLGVGSGVLAQPAALGLILIMLGAIQKKMFVWNMGIWGPHGTDGWHYDLMLVAMNAVVIAFGTGRWALWK